MALDLVSLFTADPSKAMVVFGVLSVRAMVVFTMLPILASGTVPTMVRGALGLAVVFPVAAVQAQTGQAMPVDLQSAPLLMYVAKEAAVGFIIGWGFGAFFAGLQTVGEIIDHQTGLTFTQNIDSVHGNNVSLSAQFLERVLFSALMAAGVMLAVIDALYLSYEVWPPGVWSPAFERVMLLTLVTQSSKLFALSLLLAGPVLLVLFVVDSGMGMLNRAAPQLSISNITMSVKSVVGLAVLVMALPMITERVIGAMHEVGGTLGTLMALLR